MFFLLWLLPQLVNSSPCSLCSTDDNSGIGVDGLVNPVEFVDSRGKMCAQLMVELFKLNENDPLCIRWYESSHIRCCRIGGGGLSPIPQDPPPPPPQFVIDGPFKRCDLCVGGSAPTAVGMVINMLYVGAGSCNQYHEWGQKGWIQNHLCSALQHFAREPCGCSSLKV
jgi:hypothetical protein